MQEADPVDELRRALADAEKLNIAKTWLIQSGRLPASASTVFRWLAGEVQPGAVRLAEVVKAVRNFIASERKRLALGAVTRGGPLELNEDFMTASRGGVTLRLNEPEYRLLEAIRAARGPAYIDWLCDTTGRRRGAIHKHACVLRRKLANIDFELVTLMGRGGEPPAYALSDRGGGEQGAAA